MQLALPTGYANSAEKFPVIYLLDGEQNFLFTASMVRFLGNANVMPPVILVGILNTNRNRDLSPASTLAKDRAHVPGGGGSEKFLAFLTEELKPHIDRHYRTQPFSVLIGHSLGGLFVVDTFLRHPNAFGAFLASSPSLMWDNEGASREAAASLKPEDKTRRFLYLSLDDEVQERENNPVENFAEVVKKRAPQGLRWKYERFPDEVHATAPFQAIYHGLRFFYQAWGFDIRALYRQGEEGAACFDFKALSRHYAALSETYGYPCKPTEQFVNNIGYDLLNQGQTASAMNLFAYNAELYPQSANAYDSLGEACAIAGKKDLAIANYEKSLELDPKNANAAAQLKKLKGVPEK